MKRYRVIPQISPALLLLLVGCTQNPGPGVARQGGDPCAGGWVTLFDGANQTGGQLTFAYPTPLTSLVSAQLDTGSGNLNDRVSSARWSIPVGCKLVLYADASFRGTIVQLVGSGRTEQNPNLGSFNDTATSARWERS